MIPPALTAEEWADFFAAQAIDRADPGTIYQWGGGPYQVAYVDGDFITLDGAFALPELAAKALYGRITWEMVDALRIAQEAYANRNYGHLNAAARNAADNLAALADLLESLLPPREGT